MKRILFLIFVIALVSCKKKVEQPAKETFCYSCVMRQEWKIEGMANGYKEQAVEFCGLTNAQINSKIKENTFEEYEIYRLVWHSMKCTKK